MKELRFEGLNPPEYYHEIPGYDSRICIRKFLDARDTMGFALFSLSYIRPKKNYDKGNNFAKIIHLRHAIQDLNSSFDLLLQIPWMYYRAWSEFNKEGELYVHHTKFSNKKQIRRNERNWVSMAEKECTTNKIIKYLEYYKHPLKEKIENFRNTFIYNKKKQFTIRSLCNSLKHNHTLKFDELYEPYKFTINIDGKEVDLSNTKYVLQYNQKFCEEGNQNTIGIINITYYKDLKIDIEYYDSDLFRHNDYKIEDQLLSINDVYNECVDFYNNIVDLFEEIYLQIYPNIIPGLNYKIKNKKSTKCTNLNKYFKIIE